MPESWARVPWIPQTSGPGLSRPDRRSQAQGASPCRRAHTEPRHRYTMPRHLLCSVRHRHLTQLHISRAPLHKSPSHRTPSMQRRRSQSSVCGSPVREPGSDEFGKQEVRNSHTEPGSSSAPPEGSEKRPDAAVDAAAGPVREDLRAGQAATSFLDESHPGGAMFLIEARGISISPARLPASWRGMW